MGPKSLWRFLRAAFTWLVGPQLVVPIVVAAVGIVAELPVALIIGLVLLASIVALLLTLAGLKLWDQVQPLAKVHLAEDELGRIIDEGQALKEPPFEERKVTYYECKNWWDSTADFIEAVFGKPERDRFTKNLALPPTFKDNYDDVLEGRCDRLRELAERLGPNPESSHMIRVSRRRLIALGKRQEEAAAASLPVDEVPSTLSEFDASDEESEQEDSVIPTLSDGPDPAVSLEDDKEPGETQAKSTRRVNKQNAVGRMAALERLYTEGRRMERAAKPLAFMTGTALLNGGGPPSEAQIDRWQGRVRAALPAEHRRRFMFAPLDREAAEPIFRVAITAGMFESKQAKRLRQSLEELQRIMDELG